MIPFSLSLSIKFHNCILYIQVGIFTYVGDEYSDAVMMLQLGATMVSESNLYRTKLFPREIIKRLKKMGYELVNYWDDDFSKKSGVWTLYKA